MRNWKHWKQWVVGASVLLALAAPPAYAQGGYTRLTPVTRTGTINADTETVSINADESIGSLGTLGVQIVGGGFTGTLTPGCSIDNTNWLAIRMTPTNTTTAVTSMTAAGMWTGSVAGCKYIRVIGSSWGSGDAVVSMYAIQTGGGGAGSATITTGDIMIDLTATNALLTTIDADTSALVAQTFDFDTGGGTDTTVGFALLLPASGGAVVGGTATNPIVVDLVAGDTLATVTTVGTLTTITNAVTVTDGAGALNVIVDSGALTVSGTNIDVQIGGSDTVQVQSNSANIATQTTAAAILADTATIDSNLVSVIAPLAAGTATATTSLSIGAQYNLTPPTFTDGQQGGLQVTSAGALIVSGGGGGTEYTVNAAAPTNPTGNAPLVERDDALATLSTEADAEWTNLRSNARGALWVELDATNLVGVSGTVTVTDGAGALNTIVDSGTLTAVTSITNAVTVTDGAGALNTIVDSGTLTAVTSITNAVTVTDGAGALNVIVDSGSITVSDGSGALNVIIDSSATLTVTDGAGALNTIIDSGTVTTVSTVTNLSQFAGTAIPLITATLGDDLANTQDGLAVVGLNYVWDGTTWDRLPGTSALGVTANTELPAAATLADDTANPSLTAVSAYLMCFDGTTWDRCLSAVDATYDAAAVTSGPQIMAVFDDSSPDSVDEGDAGSPRISANRNLYMTLRDAAGNERGANINSSNELLVACSGCSSSGVHTDDAAFTPASDDGGPSFFLFDDSSPDSVNEGDAGIGRMSANRNQYTTIRDAAGNERGLNIDASGQLAATIASFPDNEPFNVQQWAGSTTTGGAGSVAAGTPRVTLADNDPAVVALQLIDNAISGAGFNITQFAGATVPMTTTQADDLANTLDSLNVTGFLYGFDGTTWDRVLATGGAVHITDGAGALNVIIDSSATLTVNAHAVTNAGTFATQVDGAALTALQLADNIAAAIFVDDAAFNDETDSVVVAGFVADEASVDSLAEADAGFARITLDRILRSTPSATASVGGGQASFFSYDLDETEEDVKTTPGNLYGVSITNHATATRFVRCYNDTAANVVVGTTAAVLVWAVPGNASDDVAANYPMPGGVPYTFTVALSCAATTATGAADTGAPGANDITFQAYYK